MTLVNAYCTEDDLRDHLGDDAQQLSQRQLHRAINATSRAIDKHCGPGFPGRRFWRDSSATTRLYRPDTARTVWTDDISTTTGLVVATDPGGDGTYETAWTLGTDYQVEPLSADVVAAGDTATPHAFWILSAVGTRLLWPVSSAGFPSVRVTVRFGWSAYPDDVVEAAVLKSASLFRRKDAPFGVAGFGEFGAVRITRQDTDVVGLLQPYLKTRPRTLTYDSQRNSLFHRRTTGLG